MHNYMIMNTKRSIIVAFAILISAIVAYAQLGLPSKQIGDRRYYYYEIKNRETLYGIAQQLGVSQDVIIANNPWVESGLEKKQLIFLPMTLLIYNRCI